MRIGLIILAAGASRRFGTDDKLLADIGGRPLIAHSVLRLAAARPPGVALSLTVVVRQMDGAVARAIGSCGAVPVPDIIANPRAELGMGTSIAAGIAHIATTADAAIITPADMPRLSPQLIEQLVAAFIADGAARPVHPRAGDGSPVSPVLWPRRFFPRLMALEGEGGGKAALAGESSCSIVPGDAGELEDIDTKADLQRFTQPRER